MYFLMVYFFLNKKCYEILKPHVIHKQSKYERLRDSIDPVSSGGHPQVT